MTYNKHTRELIQDIFVYVLALTIVVGFFRVLYVLIPIEGYKELLIAMIGALAGSVATIIAFYFGSSRSSQRKDELMNQKSE